VAEKPPQRKVQAPKVRPHERRPASAGADDRRRRLILYGLASTGLGALAVVLIVVFAAGGNGGGAGEAGGVRAAMEKAGCTFQDVRAMEGTHVEIDAKPKWNTDPPSSGPHFGQWVPWDVYAEPVEQIRLVHNLEHGGIAIQYGDDVPAGTAEQLEQFWREDPNGTVVAPLPKLGDQIALTAWNAPELEVGGQQRGTGYVAKCPRFDEDAFDTFRDELRFKGPERFPEDALEPGE
jgi:hypothetical protein